jgi:hypothetical protein
MRHETKRRTWWTKSTDSHRAYLTRLDTRCWPVVRCVRSGELAVEGWAGDPMRIEDVKLRLAALRAFPAPMLPG